MILQVVMDDTYRPIKVMEYEVIDFGDYNYTYRDGNDVFVEYRGSRSKYYTWLMRDNVVHECNYYKGKKKKLQARWKYSYQNDTLLTQCVKYNQDERIAYQYRLTYSDAHLKIKRELSITGEPTEITTFDYDDCGNLTRIESTLLKDSLEREGFSVQRDTISNDADFEAKGGEMSAASDSVKYVLEEKIYGINDQLNYLILSGYDVEDRVVYKRSFKGNIEQQRIEFKYNEQGQRISDLIYNLVLGDLKLSTSTFLEYNENGKIRSKNIHYVSSAMKVRYDYDYEYL